MTRKHNIIIVGHGLFGSIAATLARAEGHNVTVISESRKYEASPASGCVLAPSWLSSLNKDQVADAMGVLGDLYTLHDLEFQTNLHKKFKAQRVHTPDVLLKPHINARVMSVGDGVVKYVEPKSAGTQAVGTLRGKVLVCAGIWCGELIKDLPPIRGLYGASLRLPGQLAAPQINVYAPYRQAVGFNFSKTHIWFGDGTALIQKTWEGSADGRLDNTFTRGIQMAKLKREAMDKTKFYVGARPYVEGHKSGYFQKVSPSTWVSTGGAKNGTVLAAWQALEFVRGLK